jgi:carboxypeptidase T
MKSQRRRTALIPAVTVLLLSSLMPPGDPLAADGLRALNAQPQGQGPWVVRAYYAERQMVDDLAAWLEPWEVHHDQGYLVVAVDQAQYDRMLEAGFRLEIEPDLTFELNLPRSMLPDQESGIPGYPCYRTVEETFATAQEIVTAYPHLATWMDVGDSWEKTEPGGNAGYDMIVLRLTNSTIPGPKPRLFVMASVHAREYAPAELTTRFAEHLVHYYNVDPDVTWLIDHHEMHLMLQANPDGRKQAEAGLQWRKNVNEDYCSLLPNSRGADLNRNFEFQWGCCGGSSGDQCNVTYRGPSSASEPETQAIQNYVRSQFPDQRADGLDQPAPPDATGIFLDLHSYSELVLWPWGFTTSPAPNATALQTLGRKFAFYNGYKPDQAIGLYATDGTTDDFAYGELGLAAYTFELGTSFFQDCNTFKDAILPDNLSALLYAARVARTPYLTPAGPDALGISVAPQVALPNEVLTLTVTLDDSRYSHVNGAEPTQNIAAAEYYIDIPPWVTTTIPVSYPMAAVDGAFDHLVELAEASVDTHDLDWGRHTLFVRGQDSNGNWGAFSAVFFNTTFPVRIYLPMASK